MDYSGASLPISERKETTPLVTSGTESPQLQLHEELAELRAWMTFIVTDLEVTRLGSIVSWLFFLILVLMIPSITCFLKNMIGLLSAHSITIEVSHTLAAVAAFCSIQSLLCKHEMRKSLSVHELSDESIKVQAEFVEQLRRKFRWLNFLVALCGLSYFGWRICWIAYILPHHEDYKPKLDSQLLWSFLVGLEIVSFTYRVAVIFVASFLVQIHCILQVLRMKDFMEYFSGEVDLKTVYDCQKSFETRLQVLSEAHQWFITILLITATGTQLGFLVILSRANERNIPIIIELLLCIMILWVPLAFCLTTSVWITHKASSIKRHAVCWHARVSASTVDPTECFADQVQGPPDLKQKGPIIFDKDIKALGERFDMTIKQMITHQSTYEKRLAILKYVESYEGGISLFGFLLDRYWLYALLMMELSLLMWTISKIWGV